LGVFTRGRVNRIAKDRDYTPVSGVFGLPFRTLLSREVRRFTKVWTQTLLSPLLTSLLYIVVFGYGLGSRIREVGDIPYLEFVLPGLVLMSIITGSYGNTSSSIFDAKRERYIDDVLISPITPFQMALAYVLGGVLRGMLVGVGTFALAIPLVGLPMEHPLLLLASGLAASIVFSSSASWPVSLRPASTTSSSSPASSSSPWRSWAGCSTRWRCCPPPCG
jgi:ABC-type multidrug transport system permease subunit